MPSPRTHATLAIATCAGHPLIGADDVELVATLQRLGLPPTVCVWNDPGVDWSAFDMVLIRTIWDYHRHHAAFVQWLDRLDALGVPTVNDSRLLRWNSDKRYLFDLARHGVAIIPTRLATASELPAVLASMPAQAVVIKPTVSGGAWQTLRGEVGDSGFADAMARLPRELDYLVQPFVPEVVSAGEWSLLYFAGTFSHAVLKRPATGDYRVQEEHGGRTVPARPDAAMLAAADQALHAVAALGHAAPVYARVDGVVSAGHFLLMELELIEPSLYLAGQPQAAERLAQVLAARLRPRAADGREQLFSYGTLQDAAVQRATFGRLLDGRPDRLHGYRSELLRIEDAQVVATSGATHHPIIRHTGSIDDTVAGTLLQLSGEELAHADAYEVDAYRRIAVTLASGARAWVYVRAEAGDD